MEGRYIYPITGDTIYRHLHCGANPNIHVDPCNPWVLTFRVAIWEEDVDCVTLDSVAWNWDTLTCQDFSWKVIYPANYISGNPYDSIVVECTMIPHEREDFLCRDTAQIYQCMFVNGKWVYPGCWVACLNERVEFYGHDQCPVPNIVICRMEWDKPLPVELEAFSYSVNGNNVSLGWLTAKEENNYGFYVERYSTGMWSELAFIKGSGNVTTRTEYAYTDKDVPSGVYQYRLRQTDFNGNFEYLDLNSVVSVGTPDRFTLEQNYPNPFNPTTTIAYGITQNGPVSLKIYDNSGKEVATLVNEPKTAGYYTVTFSNPNLSSGIYYYKLEAGNFVATKKMVLLR